MFGEITALCNDKGYCWASNSYFEQLYGVSKQTIINWINSLKKGGYIKTKIEYESNSKTVKQRTIYICDAQVTSKKIKCASPSKENFSSPGKENSTTLVKNICHPGKESLTTPGKENFTDNNTVINNTNNITVNKKEIYKEKDSPIESIEDSDLKKAYREFIKMRKQMKSPMTDRAIALLINKLDKMTTDKEMQISILNQSILNGWKSVYPLKDDSLTKRQDNTSSNIFTEMAREEGII